MEDWIAQLLGETGLVGFCAALWKVSNIIETRLSAQSKAQLAAIIQAPSNWTEVVSAFSSIIKDAFDKLFKARRIFGGSLVIPGFFRSAAASLLFVAIIVPLLFPWSKEGSLPLLFSLDVGTAILWLGLLNLLPDYVSLIETRYLMGFLSRHSGRKAWLILFIDVLATLVIYLAGLTAAVYVFGAVSGYGGFELLTIVPEVTIGNLLCSLGHEVGGSRIFVLFHDCQGMWQALGYAFAATLISTFLTSVWIWLYVGSAMILKPLARALDKRHLVLKHFDLKTYPITTIAMFANAMILSVGTFFVWT